MKSQIIAVLGILVVVFVAGCTTTGNVTSDTDEPICYEECDSCCPEDTALLELSLESWGDFLDRGIELYFSVIAYNYGYKEAKNVQVQCEIYNDEDDEYPIFIASESIYNIASTSIKEREFVFDRNDVFIDDEAVATCKIISCDDCEILRERIPELE